MPLRSASAFRTFAFEAPTGAQVHPSVPLANLAVMAFQSTDEYISNALLPGVTVNNETGQYYVFDPDSFLLIPNTRRSRKTSPGRIEFKVASLQYAVVDYALAGEIAKEDLANADRAVRLQENTTRVVVDALKRDFEDRVARTVTSVSNVGSGVILSGGNRWSDLVNSDPISDINSGHAFIENLTGKHANVAAVDKDTYRILRTHPRLLDMFKYTSGGVVTDPQLQQVFEVDRLLIGRGIKNNALEGATASIVNIWGNNFLLAYVDPNPGLETATFGLQFVWEPEGFGSPMQVVTYDDPDPGKATYVVQAQYFSDERVVARNLSYLINTTL